MKAVISFFCLSILLISCKRDEAAMVPKEIVDLIFRWSKGVTNIYFIQWIIILWSIAFFGINNSSFISTILLILTFTGISHFTNEFIIQRQKNK